MEEKAVQGWKAFCEMTGLNMNKAIGMKKELSDVGAIYYLKKGRPPAPRMYFFPSIVKRFLGLKSRNVGAI
ncbi:MAG: hypothetical protein PHU49_08680 [Syntrophorhabdaceae bacterium]|nr:hypothetical protein [Syntrophorhabdaceae bacterium]